MKNFVAPVAIAILLGTSGLAMAAGATTTPAAPAAAATMESTSGMVKAFDLTKHTLTLDNGITYMLPATFKDPGLKDGQKVTVKWQMKGTEYDADSVTLN